MSTSNVQSQDKPRTFVERDRPHILYGEPPDWSISDLYHRSWEIVKKHKVLWVFGMAVGVGMGSLNFNGNSRAWDRLTDKLLKEGPPSSPALPEAGTQVLGAASSSPWGEMLSQLFAHVPVYFYVILGIELLALVLVATVVALVSKAWSEASLIQGIQAALHNHTVSIKDASANAFKSIKQLVLLAFIPGLLFWIASIGAIGLPIMGIILGPILLKVVSGLVLFIGVFVWIAAVILLTLTLIWAVRKVIMDDKPWRDAFWESFRMAKRKFWSMLLLGLVNTILSLLIIGGPILILVGLVVGGLLSFEGNPGLAIGLFVGGGVLGLAFVLGYLLLVGIVTAFKASTWTIAYNQIRGKYE